MLTIAEQILFIIKSKDWCRYDDNFLFSPCLPFLCLRISIEKILDLEFSLLSVN